MRGGNVFISFLSARPIKTSVSRLGKQDRISGDTAPGCFDFVEPNSDINFNCLTPSKGWDVLKVFLKKFRALVLSAQCPRDIVTAFSA